MLLVGDQDPFAEHPVFEFLAGCRVHGIREAEIGRVLPGEGGLEDLGDPGVVRDGLAVLFES